MFIPQGPYKILEVWRALSQHQILWTEEYNILTLGLDYLDLYCVKTRQSRSNFCSIKVHFKVSATKASFRSHCGGAKRWVLSRELCVCSWYSLKKCLCMFIFNLLKPFFILQIIWAILQGEFWSFYWSFFRHWFHKCTLVIG